MEYLLIFWWFFNTDVPRMELHVMSNKDCFALLDHYDAKYVKKYITDPNVKTVATFCGKGDLPVNLKTDEELNK